MITAGGIDAVPFTAEVMRSIGLYPDDVVDAWEQLCLTGDAQFYHRLVEASEAWSQA